MLASEVVLQIENHIKEFGDMELHIVNDDGFHFQTIEGIEVMENKNDNEKYICIEIGRY